jgi:putative spermidine/putrescine transport system substrate-binding protein
MDRRSFIKSTSIAAGGIAFPNVIANPTRLKLRVLGTHVTLQEKIRLKAEQDLGIELEFSPGGSAQILHQAATQPESFDVYEQWSNSIRILWQSGAIRPIATKHISHWNEINSLCKTGRLTPEANIGSGDAPSKILHVQPDRTLGASPSPELSFLPYVHNADSFGYNSSIRPKGIPYETESWGWLLDEQHRGKVGIVNAPTIGLFDIALAAQAKGLIQFNDIGNLSRIELDRLFSLLLEYKSKRHFRGVWNSVPESIQWMASGETDIQSMFSPGVSTLNGMGIPCIYAAPKEGYRAWHGVMCMSSAADSDKQDAAYRFMNWWLSGWAGAFIARQGYYISNPQRSRPMMSEAEWDYWYEGLPAREDLFGTDGKVSVRKGETRTGGAYTKRMGNVAVWNTVMPEYEYSLLKWHEFLLG